MSAIYTKGKLYIKYHYLPEREIRNTINEIIAKTRGISLELAKNKKKLRPCEVRYFLEAFDLI